MVQFNRAIKHLPKTEKKMFLYAFNLQAIYCVNFILASCPGKMCDGVQNLGRAKVSENIGATPVILVAPVDTSLMASASCPDVDLNISNLLFLNKLKQ